MKKILIASGCSFTDENFESSVHPEMICDWPKWPELLSKKLDMDYINLGQNGAGNEYIYSTILEQILKTKDKSQIGLVIPGWSQCQRKDYQHGYNGRWHQKRIDPEGDVFSYLRKDLRYMVSLQLVCERFNIPLVQFQMINLFDGFISGLMKTDRERYENRHNPNYESRYKYVPRKSVKEDRIQCNKIMLEFEPYIDQEKFIGWPLSSRIGGFHIEDKTLRYADMEYPNYIYELLVSKLDIHPNAKGHEKIAEFLYGQLENRLQK